MFLLLVLILKRQTYWGTSSQVYLSLNQILLHQTYNPDLVTLPPFSDPVFSEQIILEKLNNLKAAKSPGPDNIHPHILYEL